METFFTHGYIAHRDAAGFGNASGAFKFAPAVGFFSNSGFAVVLLHHDCIIVTLFKAVHNFPFGHASVEVVAFFVDRLHFISVFLEMIPDTKMRTEAGALQYPWLRKEVNLG